MRALATATLRAPTVASRTAGGGVRSRIDTLARVVTALGRHLVLSFPAEMPDQLDDAVRVA